MIFNPKVGVSRPSKIICKCFCAFNYVQFLGKACVTFSSSESIQRDNCLDIVNGGSKAGLLSYTWKNYLKENVAVLDR